MLSVRNLAGRMQPNYQRKADMKNYFVFSKKTVQLSVETQVLSCSKWFSLMKQYSCQLTLSISGTVFHRLTPEELEGTSINLRYNELQELRNIQLYFKDNQNNNDTTEIEHLAIIGSSISPTNMGHLQHEDMEYSSYFCVYYAFQDHRLLLL
jgi:hypothetical protein